MSEPNASKFTCLALDNWRNFTKVDLKLGERVFVVGANAVGKSNLLDTFRFLKELAEPGGGLRRALDEHRHGLKSVRSLHARRGPLRIKVGALVKGVAWSYELVLTRDTEGKNGSALVEAERVTREGKVVLDRPNKADKRDPRQRRQTYLEQTTQNQAFSDLAEFLGSVQYTHVVPQLVRRAQADDRERFGEALGADFVEQIARTPKRSRTARLKIVEHALRQVLPRFEELKDERDDLGRPHLRAKYKHWRAPGAWQSEDQFSDGTLRLLGVLWYLTGDAAPLVLEEPELSLHPSAVRQLPRLLASVLARTGCQVLLSTHSPDLLGDLGIDPSEVVLLRPGKEATEVAIGSSEKQLVDAAERGEALGPYVEAMTRPEDILGLSRLGGHR